MPPRSDPKSDPIAYQNPTPNADLTSNAPASNHTPSVTTDATTDATADTATEITTGITGGITTFLTSDELQELNAFAAGSSENMRYVFSLLKTITKQDKTTGEITVTPKKTIQNFLIILQNDLTICDSMKFNELSQRREFHGNSGAKVWTDCNESFLRQYIETNYFIKDEHALDDAINLHFNQNRYHPIRDFLNSIEWDGTPRISMMLQRFLSAEDTPYTSEVARLMMVGAVARIFEPGKKFDYMPVLIGEQGTGKSTFIIRLAVVPDWYREITEIEGTRAIENLQGGWICEMSELLALKKSKEVEAVKSYITRQWEQYRLPYDKYPQPYPRQCIFIGTTNTQAFLTDKTGNRRYLPVTVGQAAQSVLDGTETFYNELYQCWAEAVVLYRNGSPLTAARNLMSLIQAEQSFVQEEDWRTGAISEFLSNYEGDMVCTKQIYDLALSGDNSFKTLDPKESTVISEIMQSMEGWKKSKVTKWITKYGACKPWVRNDFNTETSMGDLPF